MGRQPPSRAKVSHLIELCVQNSQLDEISFRSKDTIGLSMCVMSKPKKKKKNFRYFTNLRNYCKQQT